jgi:tetratricopeptide (TPR) repeat protein
VPARGADWGERVARLFLSHSSVDNAYAIALRDWLIAEGWDDLFLDLDPERGIAAGERWERALNEAASRCEAVLILVSKAWLSSRWCLNELNLARRLNKRLFGVVIEEIPISELPTDVRSTWQLVRLASGRDHQQFRVTLPVTGEEVHVTFSHEGLARLKDGLLRAGLHARFFTWPPENDPKRPPYRGLRPLEGDDAGIFYGREAPIIDAIDRLRGLREAAPPRLLVILGASGAGKSSFLRAGLLPRLARDDRMFRPLPPIRPERSVLYGETGLLRSLEGAIEAAKIAVTRAEIRAAIQGGASSLRPYLQTIADAAVPTILETDVQRRSPMLILSVDQGEELFLSEGQEEAKSFLVLLGDLLSDGTLGLIVLVTVRSDNYERLQLAAELERIRQETFSLPPMPRGSYAEVIKGPARRLEGTERTIKIEDALVDALLVDIDAGGAKDALPLLAFTLERLFDEFHAGGQLKLSHYEELGGVKGSIEAAVERAFIAADADPAIPRDRLARLALLRRGLIPWLAGIDPETQAPRRRVARMSEIPPEAAPMIRYLVDQRLLATDVAKDTGEKTIEPAHEALLRQWGQLQGWLHDDFAALSTLEGIKRAARDWAANAKSEAWLTHASARLIEAERVVAREDLRSALESTELTYLTACRERELKAATEIRTRSRLERAYRLALVTPVIVLLCTGLWWFGGLLGETDESRILAFGSTLFPGECTIGFRQRLNRGAATGDDKQKLSSLIVGDCKEGAVSVVGDQNLNMGLSRRGALSMWRQHVTATFGQEWSDPAFAACGVTSCFSIGDEGWRCRVSAAPCKARSSIFLEDASKVPEAGPKDIQAAHHDVAICLGKQIEAAILACSRLVELPGLSNFQISQTYYHRGVASDSVGDDENAIRDFSEAIGRDPENEELYNARADAFRLLGRVSDALADEEKYLELNPGIANSASSMQVNSADAESYLNRGNAYYDIRAYDRAIADYSEAITINSEFGAAYERRGSASQEKGDYDRAIMDFTAAIKLEPNEPHFYNDRAWAYFKAGNAALGLPDVERSLELQPSDADALYVRGHIFESVGRKEEAIADYKRVRSDATYSTVDQQIGAKARLRALGNTSADESDHNGLINAEVSWRPDVIFFGLPISMMVFGLLALLFGNSKTSLRTDILLGCWGALIGGVLGTLGQIGGWMDFDDEAAIVFVLCAIVAGALLVTGISRFVAVVDMVLFALGAAVVGAPGAALISSLISLEFVEGYVGIAVSCSLAGGVLLIAIRHALGTGVALGVIIGVTISGIAAVILPENANTHYRLLYWAALGGLAGGFAAIAARHYFAPRFSTHTTTVRTDILLGCWGAFLGGLGAWTALPALEQIEAFRDEMALVLLLLGAVPVGALLLIGVSRLLAIVDMVLFALGASVVGAPGAALIGPSISVDFAEGYVGIAVGCILAGVLWIAIRRALGTGVAVGVIIGFAVSDIATVFLPQSANPYYRLLGWVALGCLAGGFIAIAILRYFAPRFLIRNPTVTSDLLFAAVGVLPIFPYLAMAEDLDEDGIFLALLWPVVPLLMISISSLVAAADIAFAVLTTILLYWNAIESVGFFGVFVGCIVAGPALLAVRFTLGTRVSLGIVIGALIFGLGASMISNQTSLHWITDFWLGCETLGGTAGAIVAVAFRRDIGVATAAAAIGASIAGTFGFAGNWSRTTMAVAMLVGALLSFCVYRYVATGSLRLPSDSARA